MDPILGRVTSINKFERIQILTDMFSDYKEIKSKYEKDNLTVPKYLEAN